MVAGPASGAVGGALPRTGRPPAAGGQLVDPVHHRLAKIGLAAAERYGFALAGGYAGQTHCILPRPSEDGDLVTARGRRDEVAAPVPAPVGAARDAGVPDL